MYSPNANCADCERSKHATEHFAGRWAAKEAILKCPGTGWAKGLCWTDIEVGDDRPASHRSVCTLRPAIMPAPCAFATC